MSVHQAKKGAAPAAARDTVDAQELIDVPEAEESNAAEFDLEAWLAVPEVLSTMQETFLHKLSDDGKKDVWMATHNGLRIFLNPTDCAMPEISLGKRAALVVKYPKNGGYKPQFKNGKVDSVSMFPKSVELA